MTTYPQGLDGWSHADLLTTLARCDPERLRSFADPLVATLPEIRVIENRTGLVMLPMRDTAQGTHFHLGEVLVSEAHIAAAGQEGYGLRRGRDLQAAMAMAVVDLCVALGHQTDTCAGFIAVEAQRQRDEDVETLRKVEATRVDMETF